MKKLVTLVLAILMLGTGFSGISYAGDEGWAAAGGLLGGMILGAAIADSSRPVYYYPRPVYYSQPVYYGYPRAYAYPVYPTYTTTTYSTYPVYSTTTCVDPYSY